MKTVLTIAVALGLMGVAGCGGAVGEKKLLSVDFRDGQTLRYKFVSSRDIKLDWDPGKPESTLTKSKVSESSDSMEMVVAYRPIEVDPYGLTTIEATCESVKAERTSLTKTKKRKREDAVKSLVGKSFTLKVSSTGRIEDYSELNELIREIGKKAFRPGRKQGRIKEPDMISDFWATQWFLWDAVSSIPKPSEGVEVGQSWTSRLSVPTPMVSRKARDVTYKLEEIQRTETGRVAVISSSYGLAESVPRGWSESVPDGWPVPYGGRFQMSGTYGFLRGYKIVGLQGEGRELFNIKKGRTEQCNQVYEVQFDAAFPASLGMNPRITINQTITMQLLED